MANVKKTTKADFLSKVLKNINKDEKTKQKEVLSDRLEEFRIDAEAQISFIQTSEIPKKEQSLKVAERDLKKSKKALEESYYAIDYYSCYESYINNINIRKIDVESNGTSVNSIKGAIKDLKEQVEAHKEVLNVLNS